MKKEIQSGVYIIQNLVNNKVYIGASKNLYDRLCTHKVQLRGNRHHNAHLQSAYNAVGEENFTFEILEICEEQFIYSQENYWCILLNAHNRNLGYNSDSTGPNGKCGVSVETRLKMSAGAEKRPVEVYTVYGEYVTSLSDLYKAGEYFNTAAANIHRKMNILVNKKNLIDSELTKHVITDSSVSVKELSDYWSNIFDTIKKQTGPYKVHDCFGNYIGSITSRQLSELLNVTIHAISLASRRGTYLKTLKITK
jgi:group I intron endonuclease